MRWTVPDLPSHWAQGLGPVFVGRRRELDVLDEAWAAVLHGSRQVVFVGGEPGAGKSRLVAEVCRILHRNGAAVLVGSCAEELGPVYQPFGAIAAALQPGVADGSLEEAAGELWAGREEVERRLGLLAGDETVDPAIVVDDRRELFDTVRGVLTAAAAARPTVVVLEDLHWAGPASLQLLGHLVEHVDGARLLLLAAHRTTEPDRSEPLLQEIAQLHRHAGVRRLDLPPLDTEDVAEFLRREGGVPSHRAGPAAVILRDRTGGNPFFLREVWRDLEARGGLAAVGADTTSAPDVVRDTIRRRLAGMPSAQRDVVALAAVCGEVVDVSLVREAGGGADVDLALDDLVAMGLLEQLPHRSTRVRFVHALARQSVLDLLPPSVRARHHERLALTLQSRGASDPGHVERLAHHFAEAAALGHGPTAVTYLVEAAELAAQRLAHEEAATRFEWAADLTDETATCEELRLRAARSHMLACDFARAQALGARVIGSADPVRRLAGATAFEDAGWYTGVVGVESLEVLSDALAAVDLDADDPVHVRALGAVSRALAYSGSPEEAERVAGRALDLARFTGDDALLADVLSCAVHIGVGPAASDLRLRRSLLLTDLAVRTRQWRHLGPAAYTRSVLAYEGGDPGELARARQDLDRTARVSGQRYWRWLADCAEYGQRFAAGDLAGADEATSALLELGATFGGDEVEGAHGVQSFLVRREAGRLGMASAVVDGHEPLEEYWAPALLALYVELGLAAPARRVLDAILASDLDPLRASARWPGTLAFVSEGAAAYGDRASRAVVRELLTEYRGRNLIMGPFIGLFGAAERYLAVLDSLLGQGDPDGSFAAALDLDRRMGAGLHEAHTLAEWSRHVHRTRPRDPRAEALAAQARAIAEPAGLVKVLARVAGDPPSASSPAGLTPRELQVLRLLVEGCSNRVVATRLAISENTAANHVRSILAKTGSENRTQAAVYATDHGLAE